MAGCGRECWSRLPQWPCLATRCGTEGHDSGGKADGRLRREDEAERDIRRLKWNWLFAMLFSMIGSLNASCILPTNHQYIINPTDGTVNMTDELSTKIEPGLELSEEYYFLSFSVLFAGSSVAAMATGLLFNLIPTWYLFLTSVLIHIISFIVYPLATTGWMLLFSRGLAGLAIGASITVIFSYFGVSYVKYVENLKKLDQYDERSAIRTKGFIFSLFNVGNLLGYTIGGGFPIILAQFPETPQFRTAGWFCLAVGVVLLVLLLLLFQGECAWQTWSRTIRINCPKWAKTFPFFTRRKLSVKCICGVFVPAFLVVVGGVKDIRSLLPTMMMTPIVADSFGYSERDAAYLTTIFIVGTFIGVVLTYVLQFFRVSSYGLTVTGLVCTIIGLLIVTDWQAIGKDPCTAYSILHNPTLMEYYRDELREQQQQMSESTLDQTTRWCSTSTGSNRHNNLSVALIEVQETTCRLVRNCDSSRKGDMTEVKAVFQVEYVETQAEVCFDRIQTYEVSEDNLRPSKRLSDYEDSGDTVRCTSSDVGSVSSRTASSCFLLQKSNISINKSLLAWVHMQSLEVVEDEVYQMAVNRCESAGEHCHWIPNSPMTGRRCIDCQPICRDTYRTLHFTQFGVGLVFLFSTFTFLFTGIFLLLSDTVSKLFQGVSIGLLVALSGALRIFCPLWMEYLYEEAQKRTYLLMLTMVFLFLPLLLGLLLLYPWIRDQVRLNTTSGTSTEEEIELLPAGTFTDSDS